MPNPNSTLIAVVLDRSGSMANVVADTIGGFNTFLAEQRKNPVDDCRLSLVQFDNEYMVVHENRPLAEVPDLTTETYMPRGGTALLDAIGRTIDDTGRALAAMPESARPGQVVFCILTDGEENASSRYTKEQINEMIRHQTEKYRWQFVFLGANQDAIQAGQAIGVAAANSLSYNGSGRGTAQVFSTIASNVTSYRSTKSAGALSFTSAQRLSNAPGVDLTATPGIDPNNLNTTLGIPGVSVQPAVQVDTPDTTLVTSETP